MKWARFGDLVPNSRQYGALTGPLPWLGTFEQNFTCDPCTLGRRTRLCAAPTDGHDMKRTVAIAVCGLSLAGCSGMPSMPSFSLPGFGPATTTVQFELEPAGAEARTSTGQTCRTPCSLAVTSTEFTVGFGLAGYQSQTIPVRISASTKLSTRTPGPRPRRAWCQIRFSWNFKPTRLRHPRPGGARRRQSRASSPRRNSNAPAPQQQQPAPAAPAPAPAAAWPPPPSR